MNYRDRHKLATEQRRLEALKERGIIPDSYGLESCMTLLSGRNIDTTERMTVNMAREFRFDPDGFENDRPLMRDMFYREPYITCAWCNSIMFVNAAIVRRMLIADDDKGITVPRETITWCTGCKRSDSFVVGAHDFSEQVASRDGLMRLLFMKQTNAARAIQRVYRSRLRRLYGSVMVTAILAEKRLHFKAATAINKVARGRLDRRRAKTERHLRTIRLAHPLFVARAIKESNRGKKLFWHTKRADLQMIYADYVDFVARTGHQPVRMIVETNIREVAERILLVAYEFLVLIQRQWRGVMARRTVSYFKTELIRIRQYEVAQIMKIQRVYRAYHARLNLIPLSKVKSFDASIEQRYINQRNQKKSDQAKKDLNNLLMVNYVEERRKEATLRYTGRIRGPSDYDGRKMRAYSASCYAETYLSDHVVKAVREERESKMGEERIRGVNYQRKVFILGRIAESGPMGYGKRSEPSLPPPRPQTTLLQSSVQPSSVLSLSTTSMSKEQLRERTISTRVVLESGRSRGMRYYFAEELASLMDLQINFVAHDFTRRGLLGRFKEHNASSRKGFAYPRSVTHLEADTLEDEEQAMVAHSKSALKARRSVVTASITT